MQNPKPKENSFRRYSRLGLQTKKKHLKTNSNKILRKNLLDFECEAVRTLSNLHDCSSPKLRIKLVESLDKSMRAQLASNFIPVKRSINLREKRKHFWQAKNLTKKTSFGHHQRDKDEKGLSPAATRRKQQKRKKRNVLKTILKIKKNSAIKKTPNRSSKLQ